MVSLVACVLRRDRVPLTTSASLEGVRRRRRRGGIGEAYLPWGCSLYESRHCGRIFRSHDVGESHRMKLMLALGSFSRRYVNVLKIDSRTHRAVREIMIYGRSVDLRIKRLRVNCHAGVCLVHMIISVLVKAVLIRFRNQCSATKGVSCKNMDRSTAPYRQLHRWNSSIQCSCSSIHRKYHSSPAFRPSSECHPYRLHCLSFHH